ncbi:MAG: hypothetical protein DHS20C16_19560 [Phycisphaerae bacterium]|nr:MAG: hypothetical protein DHS20C16_19560 [Phycisphaerae bacterium]
MSTRDENQPSSDDGLSPNNRRPNPSESNQSEPNQTEPNQTEDDASYLRKLLETLSVEDPAVFNELMMSNSQLADEYHRANPQIDQIRDALTHDVLPVSASANAESHGDALGDDLAFAKIVAQIKERLAKGDEALRPAAHAAFGPAGILTDVTRQLSADQAKQLFAKLAPMLVYTTLKHMDCDCSFVEVERIAGHLCSDGVQEKLRGAEHTRDALVDEFSVAIVAHGVGGLRVEDSLSREQMTKLLEESGAMADLMAMSNCILLAKTQAG